MSENPADLYVQPAHLMLALNLPSELAIRKHIAKGNIPPTALSAKRGRLRVWRLSTIREWNADIANAIEELIKIPAFAPRPDRRSCRPLIIA